MTGLSGRDDTRLSSRATAKQPLRSLSWSALASLLSGLGALGFLTVGRLAVGLTEFAPMAHVWTVWSLGAATVGFGSQIETVEGIAEGRGPWSGRHVRLAALGVALAALPTFAWRDVLFGSTSLFWPVICAVIPIGSLMTGIARGALAAEDEKRRLALVIAGENVVRFGGAGLVLWLGGGPQMLAWVLLAGFSVALVGVADLDRPTRQRHGGPTSSGDAGALAGLIAHTCLVLPPSVLALRGEGPETVAAVFLVLTYVRAPYQFLLGMGPVLTAQGYARQPAQWTAWFERGRKTLLAAALAMVGAAAFGLLAGDLMSTVMLGEAGIVAPVDFAILCSLVVAVGLSIIRTIYVLARGERALVVRAWASAGGVGVVAAFVPGTATTLFVVLLAGVSICLLQLTAPDFRRQGSTFARGDD